MASKYQADVTQNLTPSSADPSTAARAIQQSGAATAQAIEFVGASIFDAVKGYEVEGLKTAQQKEVTDLQSAMNDVKATDVFQKGEATTFTTTTEPPVIEGFKARQQALIEARDQMPTRYKEMMLRAEANLKNAIARYPGFADAFRAASAEVTGKKGLELYSVENLYNEIGTIEKQQQEASKAAAAANEKTMARFIKDVAPQIGETAAAELFGRMTASERTKYAASVVEQENAGKATEASLKAGGNQLLQVVTSSKAEFEANLVAAQLGTYSKLEQMGVSRAQLASGDIPDTVKNSPAFRQLLEQQTSKTLQLLDQQYQAGIQRLQSKAASTPADAAIARQAMADLEAWRKDSMAFYSKGGVSASLGSFADEDPNKTHRERLATIKSYVDILGIPPDVAANLLASGDSKTFSSAKARYPRQAAALDAIYGMVNVASRFGGNTEWVEAVKQMSTLRESGATIPTNKQEGATNLILFKDLQSKVVDMAYPQSPVTDASTVIPQYVRSAFVNGGHGEEALAKLSLVGQVMSRVPESEKKLILAGIKQHATDMTYGPVSHGDEAKKRLEEFKKTFGADPLIGAATVDVVDATGNTPLKLKATRSVKEGATQQQKEAFARYMGSAPQPSSVNNVLSTIDQNIRIQAQLTGEDVATLRKEFIKHLTAPGSITNSFFGTLSGAALDRPATSKEVPTVGPLKTEKAALNAMGVGYADLADHISGLKSVLADLKPGTPTYTRYQLDIAEAEKELAKGKK